MSLKATRPTAAKILSNPYPAERLQDAVRCTDAGEWIRPVITEIARQKVPQGFRMVIRSQSEWSLIAQVVNIGIDSHLEGFTRSTFDASSGRVCIHPNELGIFVDRMREVIETLPHCDTDNDENEHEAHDCDGSGCVAGEAESFLDDILDVLVRDDEG